MKKIKSVELFLRTEVSDSEIAIGVVEKTPEFATLGVFWNARFKSTAGACRYNRRTGEPLLIELNPKLRANADELRHTVLHEIGHALAMIRRIDDGHGRNWQGCCREVGLADPTRYHQHTSIPSRKDRQKIIAACPSCGKKSRGTRYLSQRSEYRCRACRSIVITDKARLDQMNAAAKATDEFLIKS